MSSILTRFQCVKLPNTRNIFVRGISPASGITAERFVVWRSAKTDRTACRGLLFTWINCVRSMNKYLHAQQSAELNYLSISKVKRLQRWSLGMDKWFHPTLYNLNGSNYLSMLGSKLIHVSNRDPCVYQYTRGGRSKLIWIDKYNLRRLLFWQWLGCIRHPDMQIHEMMTSSNENIFRVTGHLCGEFTGPRWIPRTTASNAELWCFLWSASE